MSTQEIKPCPACKRSGVNIEWETLFLEGTYIKKYWAECQHCKRRSAEKFTQTQAIKDWNENIE